MGRKKIGKCRGEGRVNGFEGRGELRKFVTEGKTKEGIDPTGAERRP
jgi:hypothetical protein